MSEDLRAKIDRIPFWYHKIDLGDGIVTPGSAPINADLYGVPKHIFGHRVLDVGAWDGYWSFEALNRGASEVLAIDDFSDDIGIDVVHPHWETFDLCRDALGWSDEDVKRREMSVYDVSPAELGMFDTVFFFGVLYHLRYPLLALDKLASVCSDTIYVETAICDDYSAYGGFGHGYPGKMVMEFYPGREYAANATNWWAPSLFCLGHMLKAAGFDEVEVWKFQDNPKQVSAARGFARGTKKKKA
jgi:tRNA (mo5U34)-methyltransferase